MKKSDLLATYRIIISFGGGPYETLDECLDYWDALEICRNTKTQYRGWYVDIVMEKETNAPLEAHAENDTTGDSEDERTQ